DQTTLIEHEGGPHVTAAHDGRRLGHREGGFDGDDLHAHDLADRRHGASVKPSSERRAREALRPWFARRSNAYPWRTGRPDPYAVLVSEVMLQQTQAARVAPLYSAFLERFPTVESL